MSLVVFDIIAVIIILFFGIRGYQKGVISEVFKIIGIMTALVVGFLHYETVAGWIHSLHPMSDKTEAVLGFICPFLAVFICFLFIAKRIEKIKTRMVTWSNKIGGLLFGGGKGVLILCSFLPLFQLLPNSLSFVEETRDKSIFYQHFQGVAPKLYTTVFNMIPGSFEAIEKAQEKLFDMFNLPESSTLLSDTLR